MAATSEQFTKQLQTLTKNYGQAAESFAEGLVKVTPSQTEILTSQQDIPVLVQQQSKELVKIVESGIQRIEEINKVLTNSLKNPASLEKLWKIKEETHAINNVLARQEDEMQEICSMYANLERRQRELAEKFEKVEKDDLFQANVSRQDDLNEIHNPQQVEQTLNQKKGQPQRATKKDVIKAPLSATPQEMIQQKQQKMNDVVKTETQTKRLVQSQLCSDVVDNFCMNQIKQKESQQMANQMPGQSKQPLSLKKEEEKIRQDENDQYFGEQQQDPQSRKIMLPSVANTSVPQRGQIRQRPQQRIAQRAPRPESRMGPAPQQQPTPTAGQIQQRAQRQQQTQQGSQQMAQQPQTITEEEYYYRLQEIKKQMEYLKSIAPKSIQDTFVDQPDEQEDLGDEYQDQVQYVDEQGCDMYDDQQYDDQYYYQPQQRMAYAPMRYEEEYYPPQQYVPIQQYQRQPMRRQRPVYQQVPQQMMQIPQQMPQRRMYRRQPTQYSPQYQFPPQYY
ncbi:epsin-2, putative [Entamoeba invadens IP1]|uniref:Epsin-2, putative n=1 Tax=Entamoeba invadens IP1 TaxID=370355 RepID=A0A0A1U2I6_ENTIV|nr:epsin-2, putative [Entamoeba invadens IP1]ELP88291.1 epsin-2, putative [Entamoeba invadens IP1]|eukprot:XP_004255062.1 epsin-2, putative [Entamoeba invadens IP1]